jgi:hypothetical protein
MRTFLRRRESHLLKESRRGFERRFCEERREESHGIEHTTETLTRITFTGFSPARLISTAVHRGGSAVDCAPLVVLVALDGPLFSFGGRPRLCLPHNTDLLLVGLDDRSKLSKREKRTFLLALSPRCSTGAGRGRLGRGFRLGFGGGRV